MHVVEYSVMFYIEMVFREPIAVLLFLATMLTLSPQLTVISWCCCRSAACSSHASARA